MIEDTAHWPSGAVGIVWHGPEEIGLPVTGAHGFCFHKGQVLICDTSGRGPTIPGGHIDENESGALTCAGCSSSIPIMNRQKGNS